MEPLPSRIRSEHQALRPAGRHLHVDGLASCFPFFVVHSLFNNSFHDDSVSRFFVQDDWLNVVAGRHGDGPVHPIRTAGLCRRHVLHCEEGSFPQAFAPSASLIAGKG